jgi:hypothetical protein
MAYLIPLIQQMLISLMTGSRSSPRFVLAEVVLIAISAILMCVGLIFGLYAENLWLDTKYAPEIAALATGGSAIILALIFLSIGKSIGNSKKSQFANSSPDISNTIKQVIEAIGEELEEPIRDNPKTAIALASLVGFVAGEHRLHS